MDICSDSMKFAEHLSAHITPEWRKQYIQYEVRRRLRFIRECAVHRLTCVVEIEASEVNNNKNFSKFIVTVS